MPEPLSQALTVRIRFFCSEMSSDLASFSADVKLDFKSVRLQNFQVFHSLEKKFLVIEMDSTKAAEVIDCDTSGMKNAQWFLKIG